MGLHDLAQHRVSRYRRLVGLAVPENGQSRDVAHDEQTNSDRAHPLEIRLALGPTKLPLRVPHPEGDHHRAGQAEPGDGRLS
jgi:hypothetical protein